MNERIRQLADEADKWSQTMTWSNDPKYGDRPVSDLFNEKFAELIVKECAGIYDKIDNGNLHMGTDNYLEALNKTFFGVEE